MASGGTGRTFGQRQPPLYVSIQKILDKYPDGQIFKEVIQNADDAGASAVHFYLDNRQHGRHSLVDPSLAGFQGPALLAYNDAQFTEKDWKSIQEMQQSVKTDDPFKIGKFGIGFNSVYHITDLPTILSGDKLAYLEPHEDIWRKETGQWYNVYECTDKLDTFAPFYGYHKFSVGDSKFPGTFFRFPLRNFSREKRVSQHTYNVSKLHKILIALREEANVICLFLRSVKVVEVHEISEDGYCSDLLKVNAVVNDSQYQKMIDFHHRLKKAFTMCSYKMDPIELTVHIKVDVIDEVDPANNTHNSWLVASRVGSRNVTIHHVAEALRALPWVGVALETSTEPSGGRVFCVLPMPSEVSCHLPVHVNATFSLNDERRELKWSGIDRKNDKSAEWNDLVIRHLLPLCYAGLLVEYARGHLGGDFFYKALPDVNQVRYTRWEGIIQPLFQQIFSYPVVWSYGNEWVHINNALFTPRGIELPYIVTDALSACGEKMVTIPSEIWDALSFMNIIVKSITPQNVRSQLKCNKSVYEFFSSDQKLELLQYILSDGTLHDLVGIALLPLADGTFTFFLNNRHEAVYLCSSQCPPTLIPGCKNRLVHVTGDDELREGLVCLANSGNTQLTILDGRGVAILLWKCLPRLVITLPHHIISLDWLQTFWVWVFGQKLDLFSNLLVVPVYDRCSHATSVVQLSRSSPSLFIHSTKQLSNELFSALKKFHVQCCEYSRFPFVCESSASHMMNCYSADGVLDAIHFGNHYSTIVLTASEASELRQCLFMYQQTPTRKSVLQKLAIFTTLPNTKEQLFSTKQTNFPQIEPNNFPLSAKYLPPQLVLFSSSDYYQLWLLESLSVLRPTCLDLLVNSVFPLIPHMNGPQTACLMNEVLMNIHSIISNATPTQRQRLRDEISTLPFLPVFHGIPKPPISLFDPSDALLQQLFKGKPVFPMNPFHSDKCLAVLKSCGLKTKVSPQEIVDIIQEIGVTTRGEVQCVDETIYTRAKAVVEYMKKWDRNTLSERVKIGMQSYILSYMLVMLSQSRCWLPVRAIPIHGYPNLLGWKGNHYTCHLSSYGPSTLLCENDALFELACACGTQMYFIDHSLPKDICKLFCPDPNTLVWHAMAHLKVIIHSSQLSPSDMRNVTRAVYQLLQNHLQHTKQHVASLSTACVYIARLNIFVSPHVVAIQQNSSFRQNLEPFIYILPDDLLCFSSLFKTLGVVEVVSKGQIVVILGKIKDGKSESLGVTNEEAWELVMNILNWLTGNGKHSVDTSDCMDLCVPVEPSSDWPTLVESQKVVYTDNDFLRRFIRTSQWAAEESFEFVNQRISPQMARLLRLSPLSQCLDIAEDAFEDVGQSEPLTVRLKNILKDYKDGLTIVKELLQNADDAGATEVNICYDARNHRVNPDSLFFPGMAGCHGPALVFHNNAMFTQEDFKNITKLAGATKASKTLKIGKFGIGFCSVYHMTDIPSFISNQYLYIFDPTLTCLKREITNPAQPGKRVVFTTNVVINSQQLTPYQGFFGFEKEREYKGTMFRFPFRTSPSELSDKIYTSDEVRRMFEDIKQNSSELLLFLQNINCITVSHIMGDQTSPSVQVTIKKNVHNCGSVNLIVITCSYSSSESTTKYWLVASHTDTVLSQVATASVGCLCIQTPSLVPQSVEGQVFCFLPLSMKTGLPIHVSSNFAVSNNRTGIWTSDDPSNNIHEVMWNESLMKTVIPMAYFKLLLGLKQMSLHNAVQEYIFYVLWPLKKALTVHNPWKFLINALYHYIEKSTEALSLFFSACTDKWLCLANSQFLSPDILAHSSSSAILPESVLEVVNCMKLPIVDLPQEYHVQLHLSHHNILSEEAFLGCFFGRMSEITSIAARNEVLCLALECFATELDNHTTRRSYLSSYLTSNACIPTAPHGLMLRKCNDMISPNATFSQLFEEEDGLFPLESFCQKQLISKAMEILGIMISTLPMHMLIERANSVSLLYNEDKYKALNRSQLILKCLNGELPKEGAGKIAEIPFLPVMPKPERYLLEWFGECKQLLSGKELMLKGETSQFGDTRTNIYVAGSQVPFTYEMEPEKGGCGRLSYFARKALKIRITPSPQEVIGHFTHLINTFHLQTAKREEMLKEADTIARNVYRYLEDQLRKQHSTAHETSERETTALDLSTLSTLPCIWTGREFIWCDSVAVEWKSTDGPYLYRVPDSLGENLREELKIKKKFTFHGLIKALQEISADNGDSTLPKNCQGILADIISELNTAEVPEVHSPIMLPDEDFIMHKASDLAFNDAQWLPREAGHTYVNHTLVTHDLAKKLGVKMVRSKTLDKFKREFKSLPLDSQAFGQHEKLTTRIQGILQDYPFDVTILKELLQNADDARAKRLYVILDPRMHKGERVLSDKWQKLQGPALLVWNDSEFTENDIEGIQKLGMGDKRSNAQMIGQYGIGFNSVYHLTDCPSLITGGNTFCIFDPHCQYTPGSTQESPGLRCHTTEEFWSLFPDMKSAYLRSNTQNFPKELRGGSLFRFPLRHSQEMVDASEILRSNCGQKIFEGVLSADKMQSYLEHWAPQMKQSMFFLNHVTEIKFFQISEDNSLRLKHHYRVDIDKSAVQKRKELHMKIHCFKDAKSAEPFVTKYQLSLVEIVDMRERGEQWLIQQGIGDMENREQDWVYINQVKPRHGIAAPLNLPHRDRFHGKVFCFLPLPIDCNLPVHINGHFILHSSRRGLWKTTDGDDIDNKQRWNKFLLQAIASSYAHFLMAAKSDYKCESGDVEMKDVKKYYKVFPSWTAPQQKTPESGSIDTGVSGSIAAGVSTSKLTEAPHHKYKYSRPISHAQDGGVLSLTAPHHKTTAIDAAAFTSRLTEAHHLKHSQSVTHNQGGRCVVMESVAHTSKGRSQRSTAQDLSLSSPHMLATSGTPASGSTPKLPTDDWLELAKYVFRALAKINAHVLAAAQSTHTRPGQSDVKCKIEWCPLIHEDPASQVYFEGNYPLKATTKVLEMIGMKLSFTPHWIRNHFEKVQCFVPTLTPKTAYEYYCKFNKNIILLTNQSYPCPIRNTSFRSVDHFKCFLKYISSAIPVEKKKISAQNQDDEDHTETSVPAYDTPTPSVVYPPLLVTADGMLRCCGSKVIKSGFPSMFQKCLQWFLHPELMECNIPQSLLLNESIDENVCIEKIHLCLASILPKSLVKAQCVQSPKDIQFFKLLWQCLSGDKFFNHFLNTILENWALLLASNDKLYSCCLGQKAILPIIPPKTPSGPHSSEDDVKISMDTRKKVCTVYQQLKLPFLNTDIVPSAAVKDICPMSCNPEFMLRVLYYYHCHSHLSHLITQDMSKILMKYFANVHLKKDNQSLGFLKNLPLFLTHRGEFTSLGGNTVFTWPDGMITDGQEIWLKGCNVVFLDRNGAWSTLSLSEELNVCHIHPMEIYTQFIFDQFRYMDERLRYNHLQYIRDSLFQDAITHSEMKKSERKHQSMRFLQDLCGLKCIGSDDDCLRPIQNFYDYRNIIFKTFEDNFLFLPMFFREGKQYLFHRHPTKNIMKEATEESHCWRKIFIKLGLHEEITTKEYLGLCQEMADGKHTKKTREKSRVLFYHLFKPFKYPLSVHDFTHHSSEWFSKDFTSRVVHIQFVLADEGTGYTWIAPLERHGTCMIHTDEGEAVYLTKLDGACIYDNIELVWSVKPVFQVPEKFYSYKRIIFRDLNLNYRATAVDVIEHLKTISATGRADPKLFDTYTAVTPGECDKSLINVIAKCFDFLNKKLDEDVVVKEIRKLTLIPCIPISASTPAKVVLVKPCQALMTENASVFSPYLHKIPHELMGSSRLLERIGVKSSIKHCHLQLVLQLAYDQLENGAMDLNTMRIVCLAMDRLIVLASKSDEAASELSPLFLPGHDTRLHDSLSLVYPDTYSYKDCQLPVNTLGYSLLYHPNTREDQFDFANILCNRLPLSVRPKPMSEICCQKLMLECNCKETDIEMATGLKRAVKLYSLPVACRLMFQKYSDHEYDNLEEQLSCFFQGVGVVTIENLAVDIVLKSSGSSIGTANVDFFLEQKGENEKPSFCLHLDSNIGRMEEEHIHRTLVQELLRAIGKCIKVIPTQILEQEEVQKVFSLFLKSQTDKDIWKACQMYGIRLDDSGALVRAVVPTIGHEIPQEWHYMLDQNPYHIFHPLEFVGYEKRNGYYIIAQVLYAIPPEDFQPQENAESAVDPLQTKYEISISEGTEVIVTALDIHKFLKGCKHKNDPEMMDDEDTVQPPRQSAADSKRLVCKQLKQIWQLNELERSKAIRRLYLQWHPDKNLDNVAVADEVFKFLTKQIQRLQEGLQLQEDREDEDDTWVSPSPYWEKKYSEWEQTAQSHKQHRNHHSECSREHQSGSGSGSHNVFDTFSHAQPQVNIPVALMWILQAEIDLRALEVLYETATSTDVLLFSHVCFMAHEVAEKALKGGMYATCGLNAGILTNHQIFFLAKALKGERMQLAFDLPSLTEPLERHYLDTRFPNRCNSVPSFNYSIATAQQARENAKKILDIVKKILSTCI